MTNTEYAMTFLGMQKEAALDVVKELRTTKGKRQANRYYRKSTKFFNLKEAEILAHTNEG